MKITNSIQKTIEYCKTKYLPKTMEHALRVADFAVDSAALFQYSNNCPKKEVIYIVALCHDLLEDTNATIEEISTVSGCSEQYLKYTLELLTHNKEKDSYKEYISKIRNSHSFDAWVVKMADMKDHLLQTETLTEKLKEKYYSVIAELL